MKDRRGSSGGGGVFPFSMGCMSQSAVSVADPSDKKPQAQAQAQGDPSSSSSSSAAAAVTTATNAAHQAGSSEEVKAASPGLVAAGVSRLMKGIRSLSHMFATGYDGDEDEEDEEREMVIGYPTDVQHVGHIGWDGRNNAGAAMASMVNAFSLPSALSLHHLDMAMDRAAAHASA